MPWKDDPDVWDAFCIVCCREDDKAFRDRYINGRVLKDEFYWFKCGWYARVSYK